MLVYNLIINLVYIVLRSISVFLPANSKYRLFIDKRKTVFSVLETKINPSYKTIWFHASSLGEYEQGLPVIEKVKEEYPNHKIVLSFFSASSFTAKENIQIADVIVFLPLDTRRNAKRFIRMVHPEKVFFIKYDFWANYLFELKKRNIQTYLVSGIFRSDQRFFKWYGGFFRKALNAFTYFFLQNEESKSLLQKLGKTNTVVSGDTRFDRVAKILKRDNTLSYISEFKNNTTMIVAGCTWEKDEDILAEFVNSTKHKVKFIISPRHINTEQVLKFKESIKKKTVLFSEMEGKNLSEFDVFIIDTVGILTKIYSYADIAYVGGGFGKGIHNTLEPAVFGIPIIIGTNYSNFVEAVKLVTLKGCIPISNFYELEEILNNLITDEKMRKEKGNICSAFVEENRGATKAIMQKIN